MRAAPRPETVHRPETYWKAFKAVLMTKLEYRADFAIGVATAMLTQFTALFFLDVILRSTPSIGGWSGSQVLLLFGLTAVALGISELFFNHLWYLPFYVVTGELDRLLLYPVRSLPFFLITSPELHAFGNLATGLLLTGISLHHNHAAWWAWPLALVWAVCGAFIYTGALIASSSASFFLVGPKNSISMLVHHLLHTSRYPHSIFPEAVRLVLLVGIPFGAFNYVPAKALFQGGALWAAILCPPLAAAAVMALAWKVWDFGISRYEGTGS